MKDVLGPGTTLGYCTNVHAGTTLQQVQENLEHYSVAIKRRVSPQAPMGVGLWLSATAARQLVFEQRIGAFATWLSQRGLLPYTLNGFPYGNFHSPVVKHRVYQPDWLDPKRVAYTLDLITVLAGLLPDPAPQDASEGSVSTLPIAWRKCGNFPRVCEHLMTVIDCLEKLEQETGKLIHLDLEPEPGCVLQTSQDVVDLFEHHLDPAGCPRRNRRYLRVCHDTCHEAVMGEDNQESLLRYKRAGIKLGKVQISSAVTVDFDSLDVRDRRLAVAALEQFQEQRYLHQTTIQHTGVSASATPTQYEDLPAAIASCNGKPAGRWCVHYHVPLFLDQIGLLETTQQHAISSLKRITAQTDVRHFEIETYAWDVLPAGLATPTLSNGIARELTWLIDHTSGEAQP